MGYNRGDSFPLDFEPNGNPFGSKSIGKMSPRSYPIQCERKWKYSFLSAVVWIFLVVRNFDAITDCSARRGPSRHDTTYLAWRHDTMALFVKHDEGQTYLVYDTFPKLIWQTEHI